MQFVIFEGTDFPLKLQFKYNFLYVNATEYRITHLHSFVFLNLFLQKNQASDFNFVNIA